MRPEICEVIQKLLTDMEKIKATLQEGEMKRGMDEYMFCFGNCYTMEETLRHMNDNIPSIKPEFVINLFMTYMDMIPDEESREAYYKEAEECEKARKKAKKDKGEASTAKAPRI